MHSTHYSPCLHTQHTYTVPHTIKHTTHTKYKKKINTLKSQKHVHLSFSLNSTTIATLCRQTAVGGQPTIPLRPSIALPMLPPSQHFLRSPPNEPTTGSAATGEPKPDDITATRRPFSFSPSFPATVSPEEMADEASKATTTTIPSLLLHKNGPDLVGF